MRLTVAGNEGVIAAACSSCSDRTSGRLGHEFGRLRCVLYMRGGAVAASSEYLVLLGNPFEYLLEDVPVVSSRIEARQSVLYRPSRFIPVPEARGVLGRCFVEHSLQMLY
jgi:hypothetical protein